MKAKLIAELPSNWLSPVYRGAKIPPESDLGSLAAFGFLIISAIAISVYIFAPKRAQHSSSNLKLPHKIPCNRCRYFSDNVYLRCSIHPSTVLTEQAVDCVDYSPSN